MRRELLLRRRIIAFLLLALSVCLAVNDAEAVKKKRHKKKHTAAGLLTAADVGRIISQAAAQADASGVKANVAIVDKEGNFLGAFQMTGATNNLTVPFPGPLCFSSTGQPPCRPLPVNLKKLPPASILAALSKAGTGSFLSSQGHAFTSRTASFIVEEHFPPGITFTSSGPLFGVQFSQLLCSDVNPKLPLGLSADPGGIPVYKDGLLAGGIGIEVDGIYTNDPDPRDLDQPVEELIAVAGSRGFEAPPDIRGNQIIVNGIRFPFVNTPQPSAVQLTPFDQLKGKTFIAPTDAPALTFRQINVDGVEVKVKNGFFPTIDGNGITAAEARTILVQGVRQANITRAAIRRPIGSPAQVNLSVVDRDGKILGIVSTPDAPMFGFDVCVQKARTAAFFSNSNAAGNLTSAGFGAYVSAANRDGIRLDGSVAFSDRAIGFLARPFFPDDIDGTEHGPFSVPIDLFSPFNPGLQIDLDIAALGQILSGNGDQVKGKCTPFPGLKNGIQIFPGSVPLYKNGVFVGAVGISGDGVDQDDLISAMASAGFEAPPQMRSDRVFVRDVRLPYVKFPRHPNL